MDIAVSFPDVNCVRRLVRWRTSSSKYTCINAHPYFGGPCAESVRCINRKALTLDNYLVEKLMESLTRFHASFGNLSRVKTDAQVSTPHVDGGGFRKRRCLGIFQAPVRPPGLLH